MAASNKLWTALWRRSAAVSTAELFPAMFPLLLSESESNVRPTSSLFTNGDKASLDAFSQMQVQFADCADSAVTGTRPAKCFPSTSAPDLIASLDEAAMTLEAASNNKMRSCVESCQRWTAMVFLELVQRDDEAFGNSKRQGVLNYNLFNKLIDWRRAAFDIKKVGGCSGGEEGDRPENGTGDLEVNEEHEVEMQIVFELVDAHLFRWFCRLVLTASFHHPPSTMDQCFEEFRYLNNSSRFFLSERVQASRRSTNAVEVATLSTSISPASTVPLQVNPLFYARRRVMFLSQQLLNKAAVVTNLSTVSGFEHLDEMIDLYVQPKARKFLPVEQFPLVAPVILKENDGSTITEEENRSDRAFNPTEHQQGSYVDYEVVKALLSARLRCLRGTKEEKEASRLRYIKMLGAGGI